MSPAQSPQRVFFALWPDDATRAALAGWCQALHRVAEGRATRAESIHLTLAFVGDFDPARRVELEAAAGRVPVRPFELVLDEPGFWKHNRIAWAGARHMPPALEVLVAALRSALTDEQIAFDPKPFVPHVTLVRKARPGFALPTFEPIRWRVTDFVLVRSVPTPAGSDYVVQARWG